MQKIKQQYQEGKGTQNIFLNDKRVNIYAFIPFMQITLKAFTPKFFLIQLYRL